jgi:hypothetical protein
MGGLVRDRMALAMEAFTSNGSNTAQVVDSSEGSALRMVAWTCSLDRLEMEPFGAGTGDIKHALMGCYVEKGATEAAKRHLNSHSQILQGAVALGWPGLIACVLLVLAPLMSAWKGRNWMLALFMLLFLVNALVESVLEVQAGVLFFALFLGLLFQERSSRADPDRSKILQPHDPL